MASTWGCRANAKVSDAEREPGQMTAWRNPSRASVSTMTLHQRLFVLQKSRAGTGMRRPLKTILRPWPVFWRRDALVAYVP